MTFFRAVSLALAAALSSTAAGLPKVKPEETGLSAERLTRLRAGMQGYIDRQEIAGAVTLVGRRGRMAHLEAQGLMDVASNKPMQTDTIFRIASMTKPVTSVAVMMLHEEGRFLLTDPISKFIPEFKDPKVILLNPPGATAATRTVAAEREITIQHLLTHTAGVASPFTGPTLDLLTKLFVSRKPESTVGEFTRSMAKFPLNFHPGTAWEYGMATDVLGHLVEIVSGQPLDQFFEQRIFRPLGMTDTSFYVPDDKLPRLATVYAPVQPKGIRATGENASARGSRHFFSGGGGLMSTAEDYFRFSQMLLNGGSLDGQRLLSRKSIELMTANHIGAIRMWPALDGYRFGLGVRVMSDPGRAARLGSTGEYGWGGIFATYFFIDPVEQLVGVFMTQLRPYNHVNIRQDFQNLAVQAIVP